MTSSCRGAYQPLVGAKGYSRDPKTRCIASSAFAFLGLNIPSVGELSGESAEPLNADRVPFGKASAQLIDEQGDDPFDLGASEGRTSGNSLMMYLAIRLVLEGNVSQMVGQVPLFRSPL